MSAAIEPGYCDRSDLAGRAAEPEYGIKITGGQTAEFTNCVARGSRSSRRSG